MQGVRAEFEEPAELPRRGRWPEGKFLHERRLFVCYEFFEMGVKGGKVGMGGNGMEGGMIAVVALILPDVDCNKGIQVRLACDSSEK